MTTVSNINAKNIKSILVHLICKYPRFSNAFAESEHLHNSTIPFLDLRPKLIVGNKKKKELTFPARFILWPERANVRGHFHRRHFDMTGGNNDTNKRLHPMSLCQGLFTQPPLTSLAPTKAFYGFKCCPWKKAN